MKKRMNLLGRRLYSTCLVGLLTLNSYTGSKSINSEVRLEDKISDQEPNKDQPKYYHIDKEMYEEYDKSVDDIPLSDYDKLKENGIPISIKIDEETIYLVSPTMIKNYQLPLDQIKSNRYMIFRLISKNKKELSESFEGEGDKVWRSMLINGIIYAKENNAKFFSIDDFVITPYSSSLMAGIDISVRFSTYEKKEKRLKDIGDTTLI